LPSIQNPVATWEQHTCLPLQADASIAPLERYRKAGAGFVSVNVGMDRTPLEDVVRVLASFRHQLAAQSESFVQATTVTQIREANAEGKLAVAFDLEGTEPLGGQLSLVQTLYDLGVRTALIAYNLQNRAGGGCHDDPSVGLTRFGRDLVRELNHVGVVVDATHCSHRTSLDLAGASTAPIIFSHSNPRALADHARNITDDQIRACAETGGVVGINGLDVFLGRDGSTVGRVVDGIEYVADIAGADHVGIGLDFVFDQDELKSYLREQRDVFPGYPETVDFVEPEELPGIAGELTRRGWAAPDVASVMRENFLRVATAVWR
jgi:membrane dipeptidase